MINTVWATHDVEASSSFPPIATTAPSQIESSSANSSKVRPDDILTTNNPSGVSKRQAYQDTSSTDK